MIAGDDGHNPSAFLAAAKSVERFGADDPRLHIALRNAARSYHYSNPALAESVAKRDILNLEKIDTDFPDIVYDCYELAGIYTRAQRYAESDAMIQRALNNRRKWRDLSSNDPYNAVLYANLYVNACLQGKNDQANAARSQMITAIQELHNEVRRANCLTRLQDFFYHIGYFCQEHRLPQARQFLEKALDCSTQAASYYQKDGPLLFYTGQLFSSGEIANILGDTDKAEQFLRTSLAATHDHMSFLKRNAWSDVYLLCQIMCSKRRYQEAQQLQERYFSQLAQAAGPNDPFYKRVLEQSAGFWQRQGRVDLAKSLFKRAEQLAKLDDTRR
jgi:tetratricopeptide (TPR) repeat protein